MVVLFSKALYFDWYENKLFSSHNTKEASSGFDKEQEKVDGWTEHFVQNNP